MIYAIQYARERKVPFFGICLGMQCATIEYARNVAGLDRCEQHRVRSADAASRDLQAARTAGRGRNGRHDAPGRVAVPDRAGFLRASRLRHARKSASGTGTATNSIANTSSDWWPRDCASPAARRTAPTWKSSKRPTIPGSSAASFIPNSNPSRWRRIRCLPRLLAPRSGIATAPSAWPSRRTVSTAAAAAEASPDQRLERLTGVTSMARSLGAQRATVANRARPA